MKNINYNLNILFAGVMGGIKKISLYNILMICLYLIVGGILVDITFKVPLIIIGYLSCRFFILMDWAIFYAKVYNIFNHIIENKLYFISLYITRRTVVMVILYLITSTLICINYIPLNHLILPYLTVSPLNSLFYIFMGELLLCGLGPVSGGGLGGVGCTGGSGGTGGPGPGPGGSGGPGVLGGPEGRGTPGGSEERGGSSAGNFSSGEPNNPSSSQTNLEILNRDIPTMRKHVYDLLWDLHINKPYRKILYMTDPYCAGRIKSWDHTVVCDRFLSNDVLKAKYYKWMRFDKDGQVIYTGSINTGMMQDLISKD